MTLISPTLYAIYSSSHGFYLGQDKYGRPEFSKTPKYNDGVKLFPEKEGMEMLGLFDNHTFKEFNLHLIPTVVSASFDLSGGV